MNEEQHKREAANILRELLNYALGVYDLTDFMDRDQRISADDAEAIIELAFEANIMPFWRENI